MKLGIVADDYHDRCFHASRAWVPPIFGARQPGSVEPSIASDRSTNRRIAALLPRMVRGAEPGVHLAEGR